MSLRLKRRQKPQQEQERKEDIVLDDNLINNNNNNTSNNNEQQDDRAAINNYSQFQSHETNQLIRRMRRRHYADGAVNINVEQDDLSNDNYSLYDDKYINFEKPKINENITKDNTEHYIESIHHDQFFKITQPEQSKPLADTALQGPSALIPQSQMQSQSQTVIAHPQTSSAVVAPVSKKKKKKSNKPKQPLTTYELSKITENKIFEKFDEELNEVINKTTSKVSLLFLFTQGLLAGMGLLHFLLLCFCDKDNYEEFKMIYPKMSYWSFQIYHTLIFASLVGNGIKFITAYQKYNLIKNKFNSSNMSMFSLLRKNMIFSGILLILFTIVFAGEIYLSAQLLKVYVLGCLNDKVTNEEGLPTEDEIKNNRKELFEEYDKFSNHFKTIHMIIDIVVIVLFILNIFDLNLKEDSEKIVQAKVNINYYMNNPNDDTNDDEDEEDDELID